MKRGMLGRYARFGNQSLTLSDYLAIDRTILSNERTLLAYGRTALAQVIIGGSALKFFDSFVLNVLGWAFLAGGVLTMLVGTYRYRHTDQLLRAALLSQTGEPAHPLEDKLAETEDKKSDARNAAAGSQKASATKS